MNSLRKILGFALVIGLIPGLGLRLDASGPVGIYAAIEKVIFEPNEQTAERIQIWGAFSFIDGGINAGRGASPPQRGYLYLSVPQGSSPTEREAIKKEWADLKAVAGTDQVVAFGDWGRVGD